MKQTKLLYATIIFFLIVHTAYFWKGKLSIVAFPVLALLLLYFLILVYYTVWDLVCLLKSKVKERHKIVQVFACIFMLTLTVLFPQGIFNFEKLEGKNLLVAIREGSANCTTSLYLRENRKFLFRSICFGIEETSGAYNVSNDTIYFTKSTTSNWGREFYAFGVIKQNINKNLPWSGQIDLFRNLTDSNNLFLPLVSNNLNNLPDNPRTNHLDLIK